MLKTMKNSIGDILNTLQYRSIKAKIEKEPPSEYSGTKCISVRKIRRHVLERLVVEERCCITRMYDFYVIKKRVR